MANEANIRSTEGLITQIKKDYSTWETTTYPWFRGELADTDTPLLPKLYRPRKGKQPHNENLLLQQFRMKAPSLGLMNTPQRDHTDEWLFLAQHVGLPTRLLDWTEGLFIALYFALQHEKPVIWMLDPVALNRLSVSESIEDNSFPLTWFSNSKAPTTKNDLSMLANAIDTYNHTGEFHYDIGNMAPNIGNINIRGAWENDNIGTGIPVAIHPTNIHPRMSSQKSCFTIHGKRKESLDNLVRTRTLRKYIIEPKSVMGMQKDLKIMGITHTSAFPDLDSLALDLSEIF